MGVSNEKSGFTKKIWGSTMKIWGSLTKAWCLMKIRGSVMKILKYWGLHSPKRIWGSDKKMGFYNKNMRSPMWFSNKNLGVSNENMGYQMKILGSPMRILGLQQESGDFHMGLRWKGVSNSSPWLWFLHRLLLHYNLIRKNPSYLHG